MINSVIKNLFLVVLLLCQYFSFAQIKVEGTPESFSIQTKSVLSIPICTLDSIFPDKLCAVDEKLGIDNRYGIVRDSIINIKESGIKMETSHGTIWFYEIKSLDAFSIRIMFQNYNLPKGASLYLYNKDKSNVVGAFTSLNNKEDGLFAIGDYFNNEVILEYFEPNSAEFEGKLVINKVSLAYKNIEMITADRLGINCPSGDDWQDEKDAVCLMSFLDGTYAYNCTGALINNVREDGTPYFLTANHCISTDRSASTLITYFNYEDSYCEANDALPKNCIYGATLLANGSNSDFSLLLLDEDPPEDYKPYFVGWDATGDVPQSGVCIHHPEGDMKCIATYSGELNDNIYLISWDDNSVSPKKSHWDVEFDEGATESGSSGSPLFNENHLVVGQLHGGDDYDSYYGKFSYSWDNDSDKSAQLKAWLDSDNTGTLVLEGFSSVFKPVASFSAESNYACTNSTIKLYDESQHRPNQWLWHISPSTYTYVDDTDSLSENPIVEFLEENSYTIELIATNENGSDTTIMTNYIDVKDQLVVDFISLDDSLPICGCRLSEQSFIAEGANDYTYEVSNMEYINVDWDGDSLTLSLNDDAQGIGSFDFYIAVDGSYGGCSDSDTLFVEVLQQVNDNFENATELSIGHNTGYSNRCATIENLEFSPSGGSCTSDNRWCTNEDSSLTNTVWFSFVGPVSGHITIDTYGFDDQIAIYESDSDDADIDFSNLSLVAANDNRSSSDNTALLENVVVEPGRQYWLQIDGYNAEYGDVAIDLISESVIVYPNPSDGVFNILVSNDTDGEATYKLVTPTGRMLINNSAAIDISDNIIQIDLTGYAPGVYLLYVELDDVIEAHRLLLE